MKDAEPLIKHCLQRYDEINHELSIFMTTVRSWFETHPKLATCSLPTIHSVKSRLKDRGHLEEKVLRKLADMAVQPSSEEMFRRLTDLSGVRVLLLHQEQFTLLHKEFLKKTNNDWYLVEPPKAYTWDPESVEFFKELKIHTELKESHYTSLHYVIRPKAESDVVCEIQVRTLFEEIWGEVDHSLNYPSPTKNVACSEQLRVLAKVVGAGSRLVDSIFRTAKPVVAPPPEDVEEKPEPSVEHLAQLIPSEVTPPAATPTIRPDEAPPRIDPRDDAVMR
ncbi:RelA/SpoT domain-containing protein [Pseudomonas sp.]|uniref:RelA/SpoT domain-containing protein n=1 Tax=Pseudomonas sp. TaxID=306 RepID=UPI0028A8ACB4|nr:RelA/SpoT domain-containing protein [Pseudomonas sp.]